MVRFVALKHQILDLCNLLERAQVIEIIEQFKTRAGLRHFTHFYHNLATTARSLIEVQNQVLNQLKPFKENVKSIPSLTTSTDLIDHLCLEFANQSLYSKREEREEKYIDFLGIWGELQERCWTDEDRTRLVMAMEVARESNRSYINEFMGYLNKDLGGVM
ncbi:UNVERIFIED_CONTAM: hypothetical protein HDU68_001712 [Siphonaria sp. JEL0065]|nr:hypothetical protein HDU68_001712 [Siphonaria sp. JEL0065]